MNWQMHKESWSFILKRFLPRLLLLSLAWEILQLLLYTLSSDPWSAWVTYAVAHCTLGDAMIGTAALVGALTICRACEYSSWPRVKIIIGMVFLTVSYTILSERYNVAHGSWAYSSWMPIVPWIGIGLSPLLQWLLIPIAAWRWAQPDS